MKHVLFGTKSLLMGDDVADALVEYAALLINAGGAESISVRAIGPDGNEVDVTMLLDAGASMAVETTQSDLQAPPNDVVVAYLHERIDQIRNPPQVQPESTVDADEADDLV